MKYSLLLFINCLTVACLLMVVNPTNAQKKYKKIKKGQEMKVAKGMVEQEHYVMALPILETIIQKEPQNPEALYYGGICHLKAGSNAKALQYMKEGIELKPDIDKKYQDYWLGMAYQDNYMFKDADKYYAAYLAKNKGSKDNKLYEQVIKMKKETEHGETHAERFKKDRPMYYVENLGNLINGAHSEHSPVISKDEKYLMFTSRNEASTPGDLLIAPDGMYMEDIYYATRDSVGQAWGKPRHMQEEFLTKSHDATVQLYDNETKMLIYRFNREGDLYYSEKDNISKKWKEPKPLDEKNINSKEYESHGFMLPDGKTIIFASARGKNDLDLYYSRYDEDKKIWGIPIPLPKEVNTTFDEDSPFLAEDGKTLYFSSRGHNSMGNYDIFKTTWDAKTNTCTPVENLGMPINTPDDDIYLVWNTERTRGFFASNREGGFGEKDIYELGIIQKVKLKGEVVATDKKILDCSVVITDTFYRDKFTARIKEDGTYELVLPSGTYADVEVVCPCGKRATLTRESRKIEIPVQKEDWKEYFKKIDIEGEYPCEPDLIAYGDITFNGKPAEDGTITFRNAKTGQEFTTTINEGKYATPVDFLPGEEYYLSLSTKDGKLHKDIRYFKIGEQDRKIKRDIALDETPCENKIVYFSFDKYNLREDAVATLKEVLAITKADPTAKINISGHTDSYGTDNYNINLSRNRVKSVISYLEKNKAGKFIESKIWVGEAIHIAENDDADVTRKLNRRVEIKICKQK